MGLSDEDLDKIADRVAARMRKSETSSEGKAQDSETKKKKLTGAEASFLTGLIQKKPKAKPLDA